MPTKRLGFIARKQTDVNLRIEVARTTQLERTLQFAEAAAGELWTRQEVQSEFQRESSTIYLASTSDALCGMAIVMAAMEDQKRTEVGNLEYADKQPLVASRFESNKASSVAGLDADLLLLAIHPDFRKKGFGKLFLGQLGRVLFRQGIERLVLEVSENNEAAIALYRACGFDTVGGRRGYCQHGQVDALVMSCTLSDC
jgi:ribosomal protein S18 acetylase RimI-like enzyme